MSYYIDLNSDLGESFGNYTLGMDSEVLNHVTSANIACGWHAGDPIIMDATVRICKENAFIHLLNKTSHLVLEVASFAFVALSSN